MRSALIFAVALLVPLPALAQAGCPVPAKLTFQVTGEVRRADRGFTEGLEFHDGALFESSGDIFGTSHIERIDPKSGKGTVLVEAGHDYFGEGLTFFGKSLYQMTWKEHRVFVFDEAGRKQRELSNPHEGWGLTHDASRLIASDGSDHLFFLRPQDFATIGSVQVREGQVAVDQINELEYVDGAVYANVFETWEILKISPQTGCVLATADLTPLHQRLTPAEKQQIDGEQNFVLNGIAYDPRTRLFTLTGKFWPVLFTGRFVESR